MRVTITAQHRVYLNDRLLQDVVSADAATGEVELYEHTCSRLAPAERIPDPDQPTGYRTLIVHGRVRVEETKPAAVPEQPSFEYDWVEGMGFPCCVVGGWSPGLDEDDGEDAGEIMSMEACWELVTTLARQITDDWNRTITAEYRFP